MKTLGDVIKIETGEQLNKSDMLPDAEHPVVNGGIDFSGYTDKYNSEANTITISQGGASAGYVNWLNQKFWAGAHCYVVTPLPNNDERFLYHFIKSREYNFMKNQQGAGIPSLNRSEVYKIEFPDYDYSKQKEIAEILDSFTSLITNLETELASRQKQYEYYRNKLLSFNENDETVEWKTLGDLCTSISSGRSTSRETEGKYPVYGSTGIIAYSENYSYTNTNILVARVGANAGYVHKAEGEYDVTDNTLVLRLKGQYMLEYTYYYLIEHNISQYAKGGGQPLVTGKDLKVILIPIPSLHRQQEIVSSLDTFESLISNIKQELDARKKQYEYYREKLLTFE
ncbi:MAG: restriction endonuclease subunit S [Bacteroidales bacterium]|nr:restriction endonuclease subunit S [Bacteroidales bacterium]